MTRGGDYWLMKPATSASDAGDHGDGGTSPELLGTVLQMVVCDGVWLYGELEEWRI